MGYEIRGLTDKSLACGGKGKALLSCKLPILIGRGGVHFRALTGYRRP